MFQGIIYLWLFSGLEVDGFRDSWMLVQKCPTRSLLAYAVIIVAIRVPRNMLIYPRQTLLKRRFPLCISLKVNVIVT